jgi:multiple sugar transport system substrate-binding protein
MKSYWAANLLSGPPVLKSITTLPESKKQTNKIIVINDWVPVAKTYAAQVAQLTPLLAKVDGGNPLQVVSEPLPGREGGWIGVFDAYPSRESRVVGRRW